MTEVARASAAQRSPVLAGLRFWTAAYRVEVLLFVVVFVVLAFFSSQRFLRQSGAPHFIYQAQGWLEGRLGVDPRVLPNLEDWACVREVGGRVVRCEGPPRPDDRWYVSFPPFPAVAMLPFVALHGYQFNDTSWTVIVGALAIALFYSLMRLLRRIGEYERERFEVVALALYFAFGTLFFYCAIRGEVWFTAEILGVLLTCVYIRNSVGARRPFLAGLFYSMAVLTRTPLVFAGVFFVLECVVPGKTRRMDELRAFLKDPGPGAKRLAKFGLGAAPLAITGAWFNLVRFGSPGSFGHEFLYNNRVNADIDRWGLFDLHYLGRNLEAAFLLLPKVDLSPLRIGYDLDGMSMLITFPLLAFLIFPRVKSRLSLPLWVTVAFCALPGLLYQNTGRAQFGFRFSLDYTPYLLLLFLVGGWSLRRWFVQAAMAAGVVVAFWGAVAFRGYTEYMRGW